MASVSLAPFRSLGSIGNPAAAGPESPGGPGNRDRYPPGRVASRSDGEDEHADEKDDDEHQPGTPGSEPGPQRGGDPEAGQPAGMAQRRDATRPAVDAMDITQEPGCGDEDDKSPDSDPGWQANAACGIVTRPASVARPARWLASSRLASGVGLVDQHKAKDQKHRGEKDASPAEGIRHPVVEHTSGRTGQPAVEAKRAQDSQEQEDQAPYVVGLTAQ